MGKVSSEKEKKRGRMLARKVPKVENTVPLLDDKKDRWKVRGGDKSLVQETKGPRSSELWGRKRRRTNVKSH